MENPWKWWLGDFGVSKWWICTGIVYDILWNIFGDMIRCNYQPYDMGYLKMGGIQLINVWELGFRSLKLNAFRGIANIVAPFVPMFLSNAINASTGYQTQGVPSIWCGAWVVKTSMNGYLKLMVGTFLCFHILGIITPTDELHHFSEGLTPPTRIWFMDVWCEVHPIFWWQNHRLVLRFWPIALVATPLQSQVTDLLATNPVPEVDGDRQIYPLVIYSSLLKMAIEIVDLSIVM